MNFDFNLILFCIILLNQLHSVYLATLKKQSVSNPLPTSSPTDSTQTKVYRKMKPICGPVQFPEYSCEDIGVLQTKQTSYKDTSILEPTDNFPKTPEVTAEPIYGLPEYVSQSSLLSSEVSPYKLQDNTDLPPVYEQKTVAAAFPHSISLYGPFEKFVTESSPNVFDDIPKDKLIQNTPPKAEVLRSVTSHGMSHNTKASSYYSSALKHAATRSGLRQKVEIMQMMLRTKSTYPFFPDGTTPEKDPEPTEIVMCGIAKCLQLSWKDPTDTQALKGPVGPRPPGPPNPDIAVLQFRATSPKTTKKKVVGVQSPPLQYAEDAYYFNEDI